jgi:Phosphotransferase enzyme family
LATRNDVVPVPELLSELMTPAWLNAALGSRFPGVKIRGISPGLVATRISTNAFFKIESEQELPEGLPQSLCAKGYFRDTGNWDYRAAGESEAYFYRDMAGDTGVRTLPSVYADVDPESLHGVVITEDIAASGAAFVEPRIARTPSQVADILELYATLHGTTWGDPRIRGTQWLVPRIARTAGVRGIDGIQEQFDGPIGAAVPQGAKDAEKLVRSFGDLPAITQSSSPWCLLHGDAHIGNFFTDRDGQSGMLDWQLVQPGPWYIDVGYQIASSLDPEDRRNSEGQLLDHYLDQLRRRGIEVPGQQEVWFGYQCGVVYGLYLWSITQKVKPEITTVLLGRLGTAADDLAAYDTVVAPTR